jgi:hypothetical protein
MPCFLNIKIRIKKMSTKDLHNNIFGLIALAPKAIATDTTTVGLEIDRKGYSAIEFFLATGVVTDGDYSLILTECATSGGTFTAVDDADLLGLEPAYTADADDAKIGRVGYIGNKRFLKATVLSANTTTGALITVIAVAGKPHFAATAANTGV